LSRVRRPAQQRGRLRRRRRHSVRHGAPGARAHQAWIWIAGDGGRAFAKAVFGNRSDPGALDHLSARYPYRNDPGTDAQRRAGARQALDRAYGYLAAFFVLGVLVQVYLAGIGIFGINSAKVANATSLNPHRAWGTVLMVLSLILLILALIAWASRATVIWTFVLALLVIVAQTALAAAGENSKWIGGLHALDGMVILLLSLWLAITARRRRTAAGHAR
jgi:hypothetical protein